MVRPKRVSRRRVSRKIRFRGRKRQPRQRAPSMNPFKQDVGKKLKTLQELDSYRKTNSSPPMIVWIYAEWCGHCRQFLSTWKSLVGAGDGILFVAIDGSTDTFLRDSATSRYPKITGYPTIWLFGEDSNTPVAYRGERRREAIKQALMTM